MVYTLQAESLAHLILKQGNVSTAVILAIALAELGVLLRMFIPVWAQRRKTKNTPDGRGKTKPVTRACAESVVAEHEKRFNVLECFIQEMRQLINNITLQACVAVMYNPDAPPLEQFNAAIVYFKLHGNGNGQERVSQIILGIGPKGYQLWKSALNEDMKKNGPCEDRYFLSALDWIDKHHA